MTLDQLKNVLNKRKREFLRLTKAVQNKFNFTFSTDQTYDNDGMSCVSQNSNQSGQNNKSKVFMKEKNVANAWNHIKVFIYFIKKIEQQ